MTVLKIMSNFLLERITISVSWGGARIFFYSQIDGELMKLVQTSTYVNPLMMMMMMIWLLLFKIKCKSIWFRWLILTNVSFRMELQFQQRICLPLLCRFALTWKCSEIIWFPFSIYPPNPVDDSVFGICKRIFSISTNWIWHLCESISGFQFSAMHKCRKSQISSGKIRYFFSA